MAVGSKRGPDGSAHLAPKAKVPATALSDSAASQTLDRTQASRRSSIATRRAPRTPPLMSPGSAHTMLDSVCDDCKKDVLQRRQTLAAVRPASVRVPQCTFIGFISWAAPRASSRDLPRCRGAHCTRSAARAHSPPPSAAQCEQGVHTLPPQAPSVQRLAHTVALDANVRHTHFSAS